MNMSKLFDRRVNSVYENVLRRAGFIRRTRVAQACWIPLIQQPKHDHIEAGDGFGAAFHVACGFSYHVTCNTLRRELKQLTTYAGNSFYESLCVICMDSLTQLRSRLLKKTLQVLDQLENELMLLMDTPSRCQVMDY